MPLAAARSLLLITADPALRRFVTALAANAGWAIEPVDHVDAAEAMLAGEGRGAIVAALFDGREGGVADALARLQAHRDALPVIVCISGADSVAAMRAGASDVLAAPVAADRLLAALQTAGDRRRRHGELRPLSEKHGKPLGFEEIVGSSPEFRAALAVAAKAARSRVPVLIEGERGAGKHVIAQAIHLGGPRRDGPMLTVDCAAFPPAQAQSILFGHEKGAFPGAFARHRGKLEEADGGTLYLSHVEALPIDIQATLFETLSSGEVTRIGGRGFKAVDLRVIAASGQRLADKAGEGRFREDFYYWLAQVRLEVPPLRLRGGDIPPLARHLLARIAEQPGMRRLGITDDALALLMAYGWPGNVRQLQNVLFRAAISCDGDALTADDFPQIALESGFTNRADDYRAAPLAGASASAALDNAPGVTLYRPDGHLRPLDEIEADVIRLAIGHYRGSMTEVARRLGIGRSTLYRKLAELGIGDAA